MKKIRFYRLLAEKTQEQLGRESNCSQSLISLFERGKVFPGRSLKKEIARALNRSEEEVFPDEDKD